MKMSAELHEMNQSLRRKKQILSQLDQNLFQELAKQKILQELSFDMSSARSGSRGSSFVQSENSISQSNVSADSYNTEFVQNQLQRVRACMSHLKTKGNLPFQRLQQIKNSDGQKPKQQHQRLKKHQKSKMKKIQSQQESFELRQLNQQELKAQFYENQRTVLRQKARHNELENMVTMKQAWRQETLNEQRALIRKQLLEQQKLKQQEYFENNRYKPIFSKKSFVAEEIPLFSPVLRAERTSKFKSILRECRKADRRADLLSCKIRNSSYMV